MDLNALKCIQIHIPQKGQTNAKKMVKNGKKCQKITNNCKISEITKYGEKMTKIDKNGHKTPKQWQHFGHFFVIVFLARNYLKKWY